MMRLAFDEHVADDKAFTLVGVTVSQLYPEYAVQLTLPFDVRAPLPERKRAVETAIDAVRDKFGRSAIRSARLLNAGAAMAPSWHDVEPSHDSASRS